VLLPVVLAVVATASSTVGPHQGAADGRHPVVRSGTYEGPCGAAGAAGFATWRNRPVDVVLDTLDNNRWAYLESPTWWTHCWAGKPGSLVLGVPILMSGDTLRAGVEGAYDAHFRRLAQTLITGGRASAGLRLGWEFNGDWYPWSARGDPAAYAAYFRRIVGVMRAVPGAAFTFIWNPVTGETMDAAEAWPGDDVVDVVGLDLYDVSWQTGTYPYSTNGAIPREQAQEIAWQFIENGDHGLAAWNGFAAAHGKPLALPEWGLVSRPDGHGGGDDPRFVEHVRDWVDAHRVSFEIYFDTPGALGEHRLRSGDFPAAARRYLELFGG
jgi:hypothetical protein